MSYTIVSDICEAKADCIPVCPVDCIHWIKDKQWTNVKGTASTYVDNETCIDCGACLAACPVDGAILDTWEPDKQKL